MIDYDTAIKVFHEDLRNIVQSFPSEVQELGTKLVDGLAEAAAKQASLIRAHEQLLAQPLRDLIENSTTSQHVR